VRKNSLLGPRARYGTTTTTTQTTTTSMPPPPLQRKSRAGPQFGHLRHTSQNKRGLYCDTKINTKFCQQTTLNKLSERTFEEYKADIMGCQSERSRRSRGILAPPPVVAQTRSTHPGSGSGSISRPGLGTKLQSERGLECGNDDYDLNQSERDCQDVREEY